MSEPVSGDYEAGRQRHLRAFAAGLAEEIARLTAPWEEIERLRTERLRALVAHAQAHSPWHAERLAGIEAARVDPADLTSIPPMTKQDLMESWDAIVCDRRLTLARANAHLERVAESGPAYLDGEYQVVATGGSTGRRAVLVWDFEGFRLAAGRTAVYGLSIADRYPVDPPLRVAAITSTVPVHMGAVLSACFDDPALFPVHRFSAATPLPELAAALEKIQPQSLNGYPSVIDRLAVLQSEGGLRIRPVSINTMGEPLFPEARERIEAAFGTWVRDAWGASEIGVVASSYPGRDGLVLSEDLAILEPVDAAGRPVPPGERADKLLATNLTNRVLPLLRYEITDEVVMLPPDPEVPWTGRRIAHVQGRADDAFHYPGGVFVHPHAIRSVLAQAPAVAEYRVRQTSDGVDVALCTTAELDLAALERKLERALVHSGLSGARARVECVGTLARHAESGKLRRFLPLDALRPPAAT